MSSSAKPHEFKKRLLSSGCLLAGLFLITLINSPILYRALLLLAAAIVFREITVFSRIHRQPAIVKSTLLACCLTLPMGFAAWYLTSGNPAHMQLLLLGIITVSLSDTFAYATGKLFGKTLIWPTVSPNKTVEGAMGGLLLPMLVCAFLAPWVSPWSTLPTMLFTGCLAICAQAGDFLVSKTKRIYGVKDSGTWIPGHGGLLDRLAGYIIVLPLVAATVLLYPAP